MPVTAVSGGRQEAEASTAMELKPRFAHHDTQNTRSCSLYPLFVHVRVCSSVSSGKEVGIITALINATDKYRDL